MGDLADDATALAGAVLGQFRRHLDEPFEFLDWTVAPVASGFNGVVWRAANGDGELAIKVSLLDGRHRGRREFAATELLAKSGLDIAPRPIAIVTKDELSALVSTWCRGEAVGPLPDEHSSFWPLMLSTYAAIHTLAGTELEETVDGSTPASYFEVAASHAQNAGRWRFLPVIDLIKSQIPTSLPTAHARGLVHGDASLANMLVDGAVLRLVDWEYSGFGDPCSDLAGFCTHPRQLGLSDALVDRLIRDHATALGSGDLEIRTRAFLRACLAMWCARTGASSLHRRVPGAKGTNQLDDAVRADTYRTWLARELSWDRADLDKCLDL